MTLVTVLSNSISAIMIADSRLTWSNQNGSNGKWYGDECQKVVRLGNDGLAGFAGDVNTAIQVLQHITRTYRLRGTSWLKSEQEVCKLLTNLNIGASSPKTHFLITFIDRGHLVMGYPNPPISGTAVIEFSTRGDYSRHYFGLGMIGEGADIVRDEIKKDPGLIPLLNMGLPPDDALSMARSALVLAEVIAGTSESTGIKSVGGLFQIYLLMPDGLIAVPYERWLDIDEEVGTYVAMEIHGGQWVQVHTPSGLRIPLGLPNLDGFIPRSKWKSYTFDIREKLNRSSSGVIPKMNPQMIYRIPQGYAYTP